MTNTSDSVAHSQQPHQYQIRINGHLGPQWIDWFDGLMITLEANGDTLLSGVVVDQAALYGILHKIRDLGMPLVSVNRVYMELDCMLTSNP